MIADTNPAMSSVRSRIFASRDISVSAIADLWSRQIVAGKYLSDTLCQVVHLDLGWNLIRGESSAQLFKGLSTNSSLKYLDIAWNGIDMESCGLLGECLHTCVLEELDLNHCSITGAGALLIADGLKRNKLLRKITLDCNNLKQSGARALVKASLGVRLEIVVACLVCLDIFVNVLSRLLTRLFVLANQHLVRTWMNRERSASLALSTAISSPWIRRPSTKLSRRASTP